MLRARVQYCCELMWIMANIKMKISIRITLMVTDYLALVLSSITVAYLFLF